MSKDQHRGYRHPFLVGTRYLGGVGDNPRTLTELAMCQLSATLRTKEEWWMHFQDPGTRSSWAEEALDRVWKVRIPSTVADVQLSNGQIDYVFDELAGYARLRDQNNRCQVSCFDRIWESTLLLDPMDLYSLTDGVRSLQDPSSPSQKEGATEVLIDPLLYCLVYGRTLAVDRAHLRPEPAPQWTDNYIVSERFALLPSDVSVTKSGSVQFLSYINNLNPQHKYLYQKLETTLSALIPMFEHVLTDLHRNNSLPQRIKGPCRYAVWEEPDPPEHSDDEDGWVEYEREMRQWVMKRPLELPDVPPGGYPGGLESRKYHVNLRGRTLQVIVNVSETRLHPGDPDYPGSLWHVEGLRNERIVSSAFYYISVENLADNFVEFRMAVTCPRGFSAGDEGATLRTWGFRDGDPCHQYIGSVRSRTGLALVFPNIYQHRLTPFRLLDPSQEGHQTVVAFFLIDPEIQPVISTRAVGPQQKEWIAKAVDECADVRIPVEVLERIIGNVEGLMSESEAAELRQEILEERSNFQKVTNTEHFCIPFDVLRSSEFSW